MQRYDSRFSAFDTPVSCTVGLEMSNCKQLFKAQCDHIVAETPNLDVLGIEMSLIFGKCRLAFFGVFKPKRAIFMAFFYLD